MGPVGRVSSNFMGTEQTWNWIIGSLGQWVIWVVFHVRVTGSTGSPGRWIPGSLGRWVTKCDAVPCLGPSVCGSLQLLQRAAVFRCAPWEARSLRRPLR